MSKPSKQKKSLIPKNVASQSPAKYINKDEATHLELVQDGNSAKVLLSIRYLQNSFQCFSDWPKTEMKAFWNFNDNLHNHTWQQVLGSSRKKNKSGLAYTKIPRKNYPKNEFTDRLSDDITLFELRVSNKIRVHGFRNKSIFYLCWLDREHEICP